MYNEKNENDFDLRLNYVDNYMDSEDDDFQTSGKYLTFNKNTNRLGEINSNVNLAKKNTKMSSNIEEDGETENINNINENKNTNNLYINIPNQENSYPPKKSRNNNTEDKPNQPTSSSVICISNRNNASLEENNSNNIIYSSRLPYLSEDKKIKNDDVLGLKNNKLNSLEIKDIYTNKKLEPISPIKNRKKKKIIVLEEKKKYKTSRKSPYIVEEKEEKKEEKILRKDKNGVPICRKNRRKVKISFEKPFVIETPIESYKNYNVLLGMPKDDNYINSNLGECQCCSLI